MAVSLAEGLLCRERVLSQESRSSMSRLPRATQREVKAKGVASHHVVLLDPNLAELGSTPQRQREHLALDGAIDTAGEIRAPANVHHARDVGTGLVQRQRDWKKFPSPVVLPVQVPATSAFGAASAACRASQAAQPVKRTANKTKDKIEFVFMVPFLRTDRRGDKCSIALSIPPQ